MFPCRTTKPDSRKDEIEGALRKINNWAICEKIPNDKTFTYHLSSNSAILSSFGSLCLRAAAAVAKSWASHFSYPFLNNFEILRRSYVRCEMFDEITVKVTFVIAKQLLVTLSAF